MTIVFRKMFDQIACECEARGLRFTLWVDDMTISGRYISPEFLGCLRQIVRNHGLKTHKIAIRTADEPVCVTGIWLYGPQLEPSHVYQQRLRTALCELKHAVTFEDREWASRAVLSAACSIRYIAGPASLQGRRMADLMEQMRRKRRQRQSMAEKTALNRPVSADLEAEIPF